MELENYYGRRLVHYLLGVAYNGTKQPTEAISELKEALRLDPKLVAAHMVLAETYSADRKYDEAIRELLAASKLQDDDP